MKKCQKGHKKVLLIFSVAAVLLMSVLAAGCGSDVTDGEDPLFEDETPLLKDVYKRQILKKGIQGAVEVAVEEIKKISIPVKGKQEVAQVASISAGDEEIGNLIADAMEKVGTDGVITVCLLYTSRCV